MDPILPDPIPKLPPHSYGMDPTRSDFIAGLIHLLPKWTRPYPTRYRSLYIIFRCGSDPIRSEAGAYTPSTGMYPILTDPMPELIHPLSEWIRSYPIRHQSLYPFFRNGSDPNRSHTEAYTSSSETGPTLSDPIPELIHYLPVRIRSYPIRCRSLYIFYRVVSDPIRSDTEAYTSHPGRIEPDQKPKAVCTVAMRFYRLTIRLLYNHK